jgi:hypothetical protein
LSGWPVRAIVELVEAALDDVEPHETGRVEADRAATREVSTTVGLPVQGTARGARASEHGLLARELQR